MKVMQVRRRVILQAPRADGKYRIHPKPAEFHGIPVTHNAKAQKFFCQQFPLPLFLLHEPETKDRLRIEITEPLSHSEVFGIHPKKSGQKTID
jgi:hypothetical protein